MKQELTRNEVMLISFITCYSTYDNSYLSDSKSWSEQNLPNKKYYQDYVNLKDYATNLGIFSKKAAQAVLDSLVEKNLCSLMKDCTGKFLVTINEEQFNNIKDSLLTL